MAFAQTGLFAQQSQILSEDASLITLKRNLRVFKDHYYGKILGSTEYYIELLQEDGSTVKISRFRIDQIYSTSEVSIYPSQRFQYKKGYIVDWSTSMAPDNFALNLGINKRFESGLQLGYGVGAHFNNFNIPLTTSTVFVNVTSIPLYFQGKYIFAKGPVNLYLKAKIGYSNNFQSQQFESIRNGHFLHASMGFCLPSFSRNKHYIEIGQYSLRAQGDMLLPDINSQAATIKFNYIFNKISFTYGVEIGK